MEKDIEMARRKYNKAVIKNNIMIESFPGNLVADWFKFKSATYFEIKNSSEKVLQSISFGNKKDEIRRGKSNNGF